MGLLRKNYNFMSDDQKQRFVGAIKKLRDSGVVRQFADIHNTNFWLGIHGTSHFLPWHREMLYRFEQELQKVDSSVTIPYWNSTADNSPNSPLWADAFLGQFNYLWTLQRAFGAAPGSHLPTLKQVQDNQGQPTYQAFWPDLQDNIHNPPHMWVGGIMATGYSPWDPAFYLHHCWIDMLWAWWQTWHPGTSNFVASGPRWGLTDPLLAWTNPTRTPENVLDHRKLGYRYDSDYWLAAGDVLNPSDCQFSFDGNYMLLFKQGLLGYQTSDQRSLLWQSSDPTTGTTCIMQSDGNLVIYDDRNPNQHIPIWASNTVGHNNSYLLIQDDGHLGIYDSNWRPLTPKPWSLPPPAKGRSEGWG